MRNPRTAIKDSSNKKIKTNSKRKYLKFALLGALIAIVGWFIWWFMYNETLFIADKPDAERRAKQALDAVVGTSDPIYTTFMDDGCHESAQGWLGSNTGCGYVGQRYFKASGNASQDVGAVDEKLRALGLSSTKGVAVGELVESRGGVSLVYTSEQNMSVLLHFFATDPERPNLSARNFLQLPSDLLLSSNEYVYGVKVQASYYSCSITSWIHAPCPTPPSVPVK